MFGYPDSKTASLANGIRKEVWIYKTNMGDKDRQFDLHPWKTRYMKITTANNIVTDVAFE